MSRLTDTGRAQIAALASRYGVSPEAVEALARAVAQGGGTMAQFNIPEFGGQGQWMAGGMTMVGDMFNSGLQNTVANLSGELAAAMNGAVFFEAPPQLGGGGSWWPSDLGQPAATGGQNQTRYAYFPSARRVAFDPGDGSAVIVLDALDHQIGGFSQQQSGPAGLSGDPFVGITFSSQRGQFALSSLPRISGGAPAAATPAPAPAPESAETPAAEPKAASAPEPAETPDAEPKAASAPEPAEPPARAAAPSLALGPSEPAAVIPDIEATSDAAGVIDSIERLAALRDRGVLTEDEFSAKKAELLARL